MKCNILMDEISNTSKYSTKNKQIIDIDIITHSFKKRNTEFYNRGTLIDTQTALIKILHLLMVSHK